MSAGAFGPTEIGGAKAALADGHTLIGGDRPDLFPLDQTERWLHVVHDAIAECVVARVPVEWDSARGVIEQTGLGRLVQLATLGIIGLFLSISD